MPNAGTFAPHRLATLRNGRPIADVALAAGVSRQTWYAWENGDTVPSVNRIYRIADALGVTIADLFDES